MSLVKIPVPVLLLETATSAELVRLAFGMELVRLQQVPIPIDLSRFQLGFQLKKG